MQQKQQGIAATQVVIVLAAMIVVIGLEILGLGMADALISGGGAESAKAYRVAEAGARDALLRIARDKKYSCASVDCYSLDFEPSGCTNGTACAKVTVSAGVGSGGDPKVITSKGIVNNKTRTVQVQVILDSVQDGEIQTTNWSELTN